jgi:hypothetical protein
VARGAIVEATMDISRLTELLREAEEHHGAYEAAAPPHHWSDWYAAYIVAREDGRSADDASSDAGRHMEQVLAGHEATP